MAKKKGNPAAIRLKWYKEALDQIRNHFPDLPLGPSCLFEEWIIDAATSPPGLLTAAKFFGLDLSNPAQRDLLLTLLAEVVFGESRKGRPRQKKENGMC